MTNPGADQVSDGAPAADAVAGAAPTPRRVGDSEWPNAWFALFALIAVCNTLVVLWPITDSAWAYDDHVTSTIRGAMRERGLGLFGMMVASTRSLFTEHARFLPVSSLLGTLTFYSCNRFGYKLGSILFLALDVAVFATLARRVSGSRRFTALFLALAPIFFQIQTGPDPLVGFHWLMQELLLITALSLICYWDSLMSGSRRLWLASWLLAALGLLMYEVTYAFFLLPIALNAIHQHRVHGRIDVRRLLWSGVPFLLSTLVIVLVVLGLRRASGIVWLGHSGPYIPNVDLGAIGMSLLRHASATIPSGFVGFSGMRAGRQIDINQLLMVVHSRLGWTDLWLFVSQVLLLGAALRAVPRGSVSVHLWGVIVVAVLFVFLPIVLVVLSPKYQDRLWIDWGCSYLPVTLSCFGAILLAAVGCWRLMAIEPQRMRPALREALVGALSLLVGCLTILNHGTIRILSSELQPLRTERENIEAALRMGLFRDVPQDSYLITGHVARVHLNASLFRQFADVRLRKITGPGTLFGGGAHGDFATPLFSAVNQRNLPLPADARRVHEPQFERYELGPEHRVYFFDVETTPEVSLVILANLRDFASSNEKIMEATGDPVLVFARHPPASLTLVYDQVFEHGRGRREAVRTELRSLTQIATHGDDRLVRLPAPAVGALIDLRSLSIGDQGHGR